jgi:hypothetical protein
MVEKVKISHRGSASLVSAGFVAGTSPSHATRPRMRARATSTLSVSHSFANTPSLYPFAGEFQELRQVAFSKPIRVKRPTTPKLPKSMIKCQPND